jgi:DNA-binding LytR/AlgR family response regulator
MKLLIVEDEALAAEKLEHMVTAIEPEATILGCTDSIKKTVAWLQQHPPPDIILMDIELTDGHSFEIFNQMDVQSMVIFTTSYDEYAIKAFKVNSIDYLLKPVQKEDLKGAFNKYKKLQAKQQQQLQEPGAASINLQQLLDDFHSKMQPKEYRHRFLVKQGQKHLPIEVEAIAYFYVYDRAVLLKTFDNKKFVIDYTMDELEQVLEPKQFFRANRSFIVSIKSVLQLQDYFNSRLVLSLQPAIDMQVLISRDKVNDFKQWIGK